MRERNKKRYLKQQGLRRASIKHDGEKLIWDCENKQFVMPHDGKPEEIVPELAKQTMGDEVARLVQQFEDVGLPPTSVKVTDDSDDAPGDVEVNI